MLLGFERHHIETLLCTSRETSLAFFFFVCTITSHQPIVKFGVWGLSEAGVSFIIKKLAWVYFGLFIPLGPLVKASPLAT
jgi:hypothetical protein